MTLVIVFGVAVELLNNRMKSSPCYGYLFSYSSNFELRKMRKIEGMKTWCSRTYRKLFKHEILIHPNVSTNRIKEIPIKNDPKVAEYEN